MHVSIIIFFFCASASLAYPAEEELYEIDDEFQPVEEIQPIDIKEYVPDEIESVRQRRQAQIWGGGGGSPKQGFDLNLNSRFPIWQNQRNSLDGTASYAQHLGGPYGNSRPQYGGGLIFTHRF